MDLTYVPNYLTYGPRQADGWPEGIDEAAKAWAVQQLQDLLDKRDYVTLSEAEQAIFEPRLGEVFIDKVLRDYRYAIVDRALRAAGGRQVWIKDSEV